ncbi:hypothetical protein [Listeria ilorinensis]|uniref:hypothetical protein n=1 Tax=Listeria ilorinensis TaxID=2867439 RepID=UPI001EF48ECC|nr:hypothetical protein [Listeria ilorinensis]
MLAGQFEELIKLTGKEVDIKLASNQLEYREKIDAQTQEPVMKYMVHSDGTVEMFSQEKLDLELEELEEEERSSVINISEIDEYILEHDTEIMEFEGGEFDGKAVLTQLTEGTGMEELAQVYDVPERMLADKLDDYRRLVAPKAAAWQAAKSDDADQQSSIFGETDEDDYDGTEEDE